MTPLKLQNLQNAFTHQADTIIDVRSPAEFATDHIPGAINLPVLSDAERAQVGTIYTQQSPFLARKIGAALVAANTGKHLLGPLADKPGDWTPLVYCWRGGQRSGSFAMILDQIGWRVSLLQGGYKSYRRLVVADLYQTPVTHRIKLLTGGTGTAKTALLAHLQNAGAQVIDLEALSNHRGSVFGDLCSTQPSQKMFESRLAAALAQFDPNRTTWVEAESNKIGKLGIPEMFWKAMCAAPQVALTAPIQARAQFLNETYVDLINAPQALHQRIDSLRPYHSAARIGEWHDLIHQKDWRRLAAELITAHYDPRYAKSAARGPAPTRTVTLNDLSDATLRATASELIADE